MYLNLTPLHFLWDRTSLSEKASNVFLSLVAIFWSRCIKKLHKALTYWGCMCLFNCEIQFCALHYSKTYISKNRLVSSLGRTDKGRYCYLWKWILPILSIVSCLAWKQICPEKHPCESSLESLRSLSSCPREAMSPGHSGDGSQVQSFGKSLEAGRGLCWWQLLGEHWAAFTSNILKAAMGGCQGMECDGAANRRGELRREERIAKCSD